MAFKTILSPAAATDLEFIVEYYFELNKKTAARYYNAILGKVKSLKDFPKMGRLVPEFEDVFYNKYREVIFENFRIIYRIDEGIIVVIRIIDGRRLLEIDMIEPPA